MTNPSVDNTRHSPTKHLAGTYAEGSRVGVPGTPRKVIDFHTHCWADSLAPRVVELFVTAFPITSPRAYYDGTLTGLIDHMDSCGVEKSVVLPVPTKPRQVDIINAWLEPYIGDERIIPFCCVHPDTTDKRGVIERCARAGFKGLKLHPLNQHFRPQEKRMWTAYEAAIENDMAIIFHAGLGMDLPAISDSIGDFDELFRLFPYDRAVIAHMGGCVSNFCSTPQVIEGRPGYIDLAYILTIIPDHARIAEICRAHGMDRVLFGTDGPWASQDESIRELMKIGFTDDELDAVLYGNAARLLGL